MTPSRLMGLHHLSAMSSHAHDTVDFYAHVLGLSLLKQTVNYDDPGSYHLYFGDPDRQIGTMTFFVWPGARRGQVGKGGTSHVSFAVASFGELERWGSWLAQRGIASQSVTGDRDWQGLRLEDPDGLHIELVHRSTGTTSTQRMASVQKLTGNETDPPARPRLGPIDQVTVIVSDVGRSDTFYRCLLGLDLAPRRFDESMRIDEAVASQEGETAPQFPPVVLLEAGPETPDFRPGASITHHFALEVADDAELIAWRDFLHDAGVPTTDAKDRNYFRSIYFRDPDGHVLEIATNGPGFAIDEPVSRLGQRLALPPWLEDRRAEITLNLPPLNVTP